MKAGARERESRSGEVSQAFLFFLFSKQSLAMSSRLECSDANKAHGSLEPLVSSNLPTSPSQVQLGIQELATIPGLDHL